MHKKKIVLSGIEVATGVFVCVFISLTTGTQACQTKSARQRPIRRRFWPTLCQGVLNASTHIQPDLCRVFVKTPNRSDFMFVFSPPTSSKVLHGLVIEMLYQISSARPFEIPFAGPVYCYKTFSAGPAREVFAIIPKRYLIPGYY